MGRLAIFSIHGSGLQLSRRRPGENRMTVRRKTQPKPKPELRQALAMTLKREWFDLILEGKKKTEYRENKEFWRKRLIGIKYKEVHFRNGYTMDAPFMRVEFRGVRVNGKKGDFAIRLGRIIEVKNYRKR